MNLRNFRINLLKWPPKSPHDWALLVFSLLALIAIFYGLYVTVVVLDTEKLYPINKRIKGLAYKQVSAELKIQSLSSIIVVEYAEAIINPGAEVRGFAVPIYYSDGTQAYIDLVELEWDVRGIKDSPYRSLFDFEVEDQKLRKVFKFISKGKKPLGAGYYKFKLVYSISSENNIFVKDKVFNWEAIHSRGAFIDKVQTLVSYPPCVDTATSRLFRARIIHEKATEKGILRYHPGKELAVNITTQQIDDNNQVIAFTQAQSFGIHNLLQLELSLPANCF